MDTYNKTFQEAFLLVRLSRKRAKDKKWFTASMRKSKHTEQKLYKLKVRSPTHINIEKYKKYKSVYSKGLKSAEQHYFQDIISSKNKMSPYHSLFTWFNI